MAYFVNVTVGKCSIFSIYDLAGFFCRDGDGEIKNRNLNTISNNFDVDVDEGEDPGDPGQIKVSGQLDGERVITVRLYKISKSGGTITFPNPHVVYALSEDVPHEHKTTVEMIHENPKFDDFVSAVGNWLASQKKHPQADETDDHPK